MSGVILHRVMALFLGKAPSECPAVCLNQVPPVNAKDKEPASPNPHP